MIQKISIYYIFMESSILPILLMSNSSLFYVYLYLFFSLCTCLYMQCACVYVCLHLCGHRCVCALQYACGSQRLTQGDFPNHSLPYSRRHSLSVISSTHSGCSTQPACPGNFFLHFLSTVIIGGLPVPASIHMGAGHWLQFSCLLDKDLLPHHLCSANLCLLFTYTLQTLTNVKIMATFYLCFYMGMRPDPTVRMCWGRRVLQTC